MSNAFIIDGKAFAAQLRQRVAAAVESFVALTARKPGLAVVLVGEDPASPSTSAWPLTGWRCWATRWAAMARW